MQQQTFTQNQQRTQGQQRLNQPPSCLTTKDLAYLKDAMSWELVTMKKLNHFAQECQHNEIKQTINRAGKMHEKHYKMLLNHVNPAKALQNQQ